MKDVLVVYQSISLENMRNRCADRRNTKKYRDIYLISNIYLCGCNNAVLFPTQVVGKDESSILNKKS